MIYFLIVIQLCILLLYTVLKMLHGFFSERVNRALITQIFADTSFLQNIFGNFIFGLQYNIIVLIHVISKPFKKYSTLSLRRQL